MCSTHFHFYSVSPAELAVSTDSDSVILIFSGLGFLYVRPDLVVMYVYPIFKQETVVSHCSAATKCRGPRTGV